MDRRRRKEKENLALALCLNTNMAGIQLLALQSLLSANIQMTVCCVFYASSNLINVDSRAVTADRGSSLSQAFSLRRVSLLSLCASFPFQRGAEVTQEEMSSNGDWHVGPWLLWSVLKSCLMVQRMDGVLDTCRGLHGVMETPDSSWRGRTIPRGSLRRSCLWKRVAMVSFDFISFVNSKNQMLQKQQTAEVDMQIHGAVSGHSHWNSEIQPIHIANLTQTIFF